jgi:hypothetical protein
MTNHKQGINKIYSLPASPTQAAGNTCVSGYCKIIELHATVIIELLLRIMGGRLVDFGVC